MDKSFDELTLAMRQDAFEPVLGCFRKYVEFRQLGLSVKIATSLAKRTYYYGYGRNNKEILEYLIRDREETDEKA